MNDDELAKSHTKTEVESEEELFSDNPPPQDKWGTCEIMKHGEVIESFKVPFTQKELDCIKRVKDTTNHPGLMKGYVNGGPERESMLWLLEFLSHTGSMTGNAQ